MDELRNDWLQVFSDRRVIFDYPKFVKAVGDWLDYIGFVDLFPAPIRLYFQLRYKKMPPSMAGDNYWQRVPPLDMFILGQPRHVDANGFIGETIGEPKPLGKVEIFCPTAREIQIRTIFEHTAPPDVQNVIIALGTKINACIDHANAHPIPADGSPAPAPTASNAPDKTGYGTRKGGRTPDPLNVWAIEEIDGGRDRGDVEREYWRKRRERGDAVDAIGDLKDVWRKNVLEKTKK